MVLIEGLALTSHRQGKLDEALKYLRDAKEISESGVDADHLAWVQFRTGSVLLSMGRREDALERFNLALPVLRKQNDTLHVAFTLLGQAEAYASLGRPAHAAAAMRDADALVKTLNISRLRSMSLKTGAAIAAAGSDYKLAYERALSMADAQRDAVQSASRRELESEKVRFDMAHKEAENSVLRAKEAAAQSHRTLTSFLLAGGSLSVLAAGGFLWRDVKQKRRFATMALRDDLTGASNRRSMMQSSPREIEARRQTGGTLIGLIDIDHFKRVNDTFGHDVGDLVLKAFYTACASTLRRSVLTQRNLHRSGR